MARYIAVNFAGAMAGFLPLLPMMAIFHFMMRKKDKANHIKAEISHIFAVYLFCFGLVSVLSVTSVPGIYYMSIDTGINLVPFVGVSNNLFEYVLNIILFIPVGFLLPMLWKKFEKMYITFLWGFFFSLSIEMIQLLNNRITDIDDLITNTVGTIIGYFFFKLLKKIFPRIAVFSMNRTNGWKREPYFCFCFAWASALVFSAFLSRLFFGPVIIR